MTKEPALIIGTIACDHGLATSNGAECVGKATTTTVVLSVIFVLLSDFGLNFDVVVGTGSATTGFSASYLDVASITTATTKPLRLVDLWTNWSMGNSPEGAGTSSTLAPGTQAGAYNWAVVAINNTGQQGI